MKCANFIINSSNFFITSRLTVNRDGNINSLSTLCYAFLIYIFSTSEKG